MKVFVTGASGFIGSVLLPELVDAGHEVIALARSENAAAKIHSIDPNIDILYGTLEDLDILKRGATETDATIHLAFVHDFENYVKSCELDRQAVTTMLESIEGTNKTFVVTQGSLGLPLGKLATEKDIVSGPRGETEQITLDFAKRGVRSMSVRLAPTVHGKGDHAFIPSIIGAAKNAGRSIYIGNGKNVWPAVHRVDAAHLYRLVLENGLSGRAYHAIAEQGLKTQLIAETVGEILHIPTVSASQQEGLKQLGFLGSFFALDNPVSSEETQSDLGWKPVNFGLIEDIRNNYSA